MRGRWVSVMHHRDYNAGCTVTRGAWCSSKRQTQKPEKFAVKWASTPLKCSSNKPCGTVSTLVGTRLYNV